jgi:hypothetical protein
MCLHDLPAGDSARRHQTNQFVSRQVAKVRHS